MKTIVDLTEELKKYTLEKDTAAKQAVEANIAPVEADASSASRAYVVGEQLFLNDVLYDVTSPISVGDAIVVNTNITAANKLSADIKSKIDDLYSKNQTLTNNVNVLAENGAVNLAPNNMVNSTSLGVTFTVNSNGSITASGTATGNIRIDIGKFTLKAGVKYKISDLANGQPSLTPGDLIYARRASDFKWIMDTYGSGGQPTELTPAADLEVLVGIGIDNGLSVDKTFYPMIADANYFGPYVPYAKTNKELTEDVKELTEDVSRIDGEVIKIVDSGFIDANSSHSFNCTNHRGYRLSIYSIGGNNIGMIALFGKHPSVSDVRYSVFNCDNREAYAPQISVSGSTLTITTTRLNCYYVIERILGT